MKIRVTINIGDRYRIWQYKTWFIFFWWEKIFDEPNEKQFNDFLKELKKRDVK